MLFITYAIVAAAAAVSAQASTDAPVVSSNPLGASYVANFPEKGTVRGSVIGSSANDGKGVNFAISISGIPAEGGPFMYHIHEKPISADGNCSSAGAHLDPYKRGEVPLCDSSKKETCQTGDLSGKERNFTGPADSIMFLDLYSATNPEDPAFFGDKSIVFHYSNKTRITCANFTIVNGGQPSAAPSSGYAMPTSSPALHANSTGSHGPSHTPSFTSSPPTPSAPAPSSGADRLMVAGAGVLAGAIAMLL